MSKKIVKIFMVMLLLISTVQFLNVFDVSAKSVKFSGVYKNVFEYSLFITKLNIIWN